MKTALIFGISGQDGALLARLLLKKGYRVIGVSRHHPSHRFDNLLQLGIHHQVTLARALMLDQEQVRQVIEMYAPDEIYNLAGQSSVGRSFDNPVETFDSIAVASLYLMETIRNLNMPVKLFNAGSGDCFGDCSGRSVTEEDPFDPKSPYAIAKVTALQHVDTFREAYGLFACTGILFNHESFLRPTWFVTRKIVDTALEIAGGRSRELVLGDISIRRDWGWAPEYVDAMWRMLQQPEPEDFIIATGNSISLADFMDAVFSRLGLERHKYVRTDSRFIRPTEIPVMAADPSKANRRLGWKARYSGTRVAGLMLDAIRNRTYRPETIRNPN
jgi:GDPmannose 4,6-dehydratase